MENYPIGIVLKEYRTRLNISQEELCLDLCAVSTLSRIESGTQVPGRKLLEALFSRMGMNRSVPITKVDFQRENLEYRINDMIATGKFEIFDLLEEYKNCGESLTSLEEQFYLFYKTIAEDHLNHNSAKALENYVTALRLSIHDYDLNRLPIARFLTKTELLILNHIARINYFINQKDKAIEMMEFLRSYFEKGIVSEEEKAKNYPVILQNLENWYGLANKDEKVIELCDIGIDICIHYGKLTPFPYQIFNKGCSLVKLGKTEEGKKYLMQAFTIFETLNSYDEVEFGKKFVKDNLGIEL
jgi:transcriptional regulator with XRE-family HTH domain